MSIFQFPAFSLARLLPAVMVFFSLAADAQQAKIDSLVKLVSIAKEDTNKVILLQQLTNAYLTNDPKTALETAKQNISLARALGYKKGLGNALNQAGEANRFMSNYSTAHRYYIESLKIREEIGDKKGIAGSKNNIGLVFESQKNPQAALRYYFESLQLKEELNDKRGIAGTLNNIGIIYKEYDKNYPKALEYYERALKINREIGNKQWELTNMQNIGLIHKNTKNYGKALEFYREARQLNKDVQNMRIEVSLLLSIGQVMYDTGNIDSAEYYFTRTVDLARKIEAKENEARGYMGLSDISAHRNDFKKAYEYQSHARLLENEVIRESNNKEIAEMQVRYESDKKEKAIELLTHRNRIQEYDLERKRIWIYTAAAGTVLLLLLALILFNRYRIKQRANRELELKNSEITAQKAIIQEKNKDITDSIRYAKRIQEAILPPEHLLQEGLDDHFVLYIPKDIVSGDFYWTGESEGKKLVAAVDCTGHGVPGAFMSLVGYNQLNHALKEKRLSQPSLILDEINAGVIETLQREGEGSLKDGMDIALCAIDKVKRKVEYAGAYNPMWIVRGNGQTSHLIEIKGDKQAIGAGRKTYSNHEIELQQEDALYIFSDGFADQFGGEKQKKFTSKQLKNLLVSIAHFSMSEQKDALRKAFLEWKGDLEQVDDILLIGIRV